MPTTPEYLLKNARDLRQTQTDAENYLWIHLRSRRLGGYKFRRQYPLAPYILDFYCDRRKLAVELDGSQHFSETGRAYDAKRDRFIAQQGIQTLRFDNRQVLLETEAVLGRILGVLES